jgi:O-antigen ligase
VNEQAVQRLTRPTPMSFLAILWLLVIDALNRFQVGAFSAGAALTGLALVVALAALWQIVGAGYVDRLDREPFLPPASKAVPAPLTAFLLWVLLKLPFGLTVDGAQNVMVYLSFILVMIVTSRLSSAGTADAILRRMRLVGWVAAGLYLATVAQSGLEAATLYSPRAFALAALILLAGTVAAGNSRWLPLVLVVAIVASLSRTATVVSLAIFCLGLAVRGQRSGRLFRVLAMILLALVAGWELVTRYAPMRDRFLGGDRAVDYGGLKFNTSGRSDIWAAVWASCKHHLWVGGGPGSAEQVVTAIFGTKVTHPHNDYLRLLHDFGLVGLALFVLGYLMLLRRTWVRGRVTGHPIHWAAFLSLLAVAGVAFTDNVIVYPFVMIPLGLIVGASLARTPRPAGADPAAGETDDAELDVAPWVTRTEAPALGLTARSGLHAVGPRPLADGDPR